MNIFYQTFDFLWILAKELLAIFVIILVGKAVLKIIIPKPIKKTCIWTYNKIAIPTIRGILKTLILPFKAHTVNAIKKPLRRLEAEKRVRRINLYKNEKVKKQERIYNNMKKIKEKQKQKYEELGVIDINDYKKEG